MYLMYFISRHFVVFQERFKEFELRFMDIEGLL
jgi:hypothetical protein